jgi:tetratricopeptide (TPR) repeat protein
MCRGAVGQRLRAVIVFGFLLTLGKAGPMGVGQACAAPPPALTQEQQKRLQRRDRLAAEAEKLRAEGKLAEAIAAAEKMLDVEREVLGRVHPDMVGSLHLLADMHEEREAFKEARQARAEALEIQTRLRGADHWRVSDARQALAHSERLAGLSAEQRRLLREAGRLHKQAQDLAGKDKIKEALSLVQRAWVTYKEVLGEEDVDSIACLRELGLLSGRQGSFARASTLLLRAVNLNKKVLGATHPGYAAALNDLAWAYQGLHEEVQAERCYLESVEVIRKAEGEQSLGYLQTLQSLASLYEDHFAHEKAEPIYVQMLEIRRKSGRDKDADFARTLHRLGRVYQWQQKDARAEPLLRQALTLSTELLGARHRDTLAVLELLISSLYSQAWKCKENEDFAGAVQRYRELIKLQEQWYGRDSWRVRDTRLEMAHVERLPLLSREQRKRLSEAARLHRDAVREAHNRFLTPKLSRR